MRSFCKADHGCPLSRHSRRPGYLDGLVWLLAPACQLPHCCLGQALVTPPPAQDPPLLKDAGFILIANFNACGLLVPDCPGQSSQHKPCHSGVYGTCFGLVNPFEALQWPAAPLRFYCVSLSCALLSSGQAGDINELLNGLLSLLQRAFTPMSSLDTHNLQKHKQTWRGCGLIIFNEWLIERYVSSRVAR